jgi:hypothetical protein
MSPTRYRFSTPRPETYGAGAAGHNAAGASRGEDGGLQRAAACPGETRGQRAAGRGAGGSG